ncbi:MAG: CHAT domain-containing protein, partial [Microcystaceae cyanobacterium]
AEQAIQDSLTNLQTESALRVPGVRLAALAQTLNNQGNLQFAQGQMQQALLSWEKAADFYAQVGNPIGILRSQINQAQALQTLGLYRRALKILTQVSQDLSNQPDSTLKAVSLRILGNTLRLTGELERSEQILQESLAIAQRLSSLEDEGMALLNLGKTAQAKNDLPTALAFYQQAASLATSPSTRLQSHLAQLNVLIDTQQWTTAIALLGAIKDNLAQLPPSHSKVYGQINLADNLMRLQQVQTTPALNVTVPSWKEIAQLLMDAIQQAEQLGDKQAEAYALGSLGKVYENTQQVLIAQTLTERALIIAQAINVPEITYRWQWQLGRLLHHQGKREAAIQAYSEAVKTLQSIRSDLVSNPDIQFSFREQVEPVYRELVSLLLEKNAQGDVSQANLIQARDVIESLQLAELDNFLREACLEAKPVQIDQVDPQAAVIYSIILRDRLAVILSLPQQPLRHYAVSLSQEKLEKLMTQLSYKLVVRSRREFFEPAQQLYDWLIRPAEIALAQSGVKTLVFVLDGALRNIPMASLYDGKHYLVEQYSIAITPGLQLLAPQALQPRQLTALTAGLTQEREGFAPLNYIVQELAAVQAKIPS